jgi:FKBP-type peptidyl-prolyl cis-trans isomerase (trigger factor)
VAEKHYTIEKIEELPHSEASITGEISLAFLESCRSEAIKSLNERISLPGFRQGLVPENVLVKTVGQMSVLEETAEVALAKEYGNIIVESKLKPIMRPEISVTKLAPGIPLAFKINLVLEPTFELPDYKTIAKETKEEDKDKRQVMILENLVKETKLELPQKFVETEVSHMFHHFKQDLDKAGIKFEDYLKKIEKTEEDVKNSWREHIVSRAKIEFIIAKIAQQENLKTYPEVFAFLEKA